MPELPEIETLQEELKHSGLIGCTIKQVKVYWYKTVGCPDLQTFLNLLPNKKIKGISRRAKFLILHLSHHYDLLIHLRMTGRLLLVAQQTPESSYVRLAIELDNGQELRFQDTRKFGRWYLVSHPHSLFDHLGPEPLDPTFSLKDFQILIRNRQRTLKPLLLDQHFLADLGNIYVDEALWEARLHPLRRANTLTSQEIQNLYKGIIHVLNRGIASYGTTLGSGKTNYYRLSGKQGNHQHLLQVFRRTGTPCPRCGHSIQRVRIAQRSTHYCPHCQII